MTNYEYIKKHTLKELTIAAIENALTYPMDWKAAEGLEMVLDLMKEVNDYVQLPKDHECDLRRSDLPIHESGSDEG